MKTVNLGNTKELVSKMCLGTMYFGSRVDEKTSFELMDYYYEKGGRLFDTANNYCFWLGDYKGDESETMVGKWIKARNNRKDIFLATKCGVRPKESSSNDVGDLQFEGLSKEAVLSAAERSLERLQTDYIDLYYIHADWRKEPLEETLEALDSLVKSGKVKYIACSNMATWRIMKAREISKRNGWAEFVGVQNWYSYLKPRDKADLWVQKYVNEELLDYIETEEEMTIFAYTSTLGGLYNWDTIYDKKHPALFTRFFSEDNERRFEVIKNIAAKKQLSPFQVLFAWILKHKANIIPILGVTKMSQLKENLASFDVTLTDEEFDSMNNAAFNNKEYLDQNEYSLLG